MAPRVVGGSTARVPAGGNATFELQVSRTWTAPMKVNVSDSETPQATPKALRITPGASLIQPSGSAYSFQVTVQASRTIAAGAYTVAVTVSDGLVQQTAYLFITVA